MNISPQGKGEDPFPLIIDTDEKDLLHIVHTRMQISLEEITEITEQEEKERD